MEEDYTVPVHLQAEVEKKIKKKKRIIKRRK